MQCRQRERQLQRVPVAVGVDGAARERHVIQVAGCASRRNLGFVVRHVAQRQRGYSAPLRHQRDVCVHRRAEIVVNAAQHPAPEIVAVTCRCRRFAGGHALGNVLRRYSRSTVRVEGDHGLLFPLCHQRDILVHRRAEIVGNAALRPTSKSVTRAGRCRRFAGC